MTTTALERAIRGQPELLSRVLELELGDVVARLAETEGSISLVGTGTSQHAAELGAQMLRLAGVNATAYSAATFARRRPSFDPGDAIILITHTGETAFAQQVRSRAMSQGASLVSLTAEGVGWPEALEIAPRERSETYTASYTSCLLLLARIGGALGAKELDEAALAAVPEAVERAVEAPTPIVNPEARVLVFAGWGPGATSAREGALKVREAARVVSEGYEGEYLLHGSAVPLAPEDSLVLLEPDSDPDHLLPALGKAAAAEGIAVTEVSSECRADPLLRQIPLTVRLQRLASELAAARACDPDHVIVGGWTDERLWAAGNGSS